MGAPFNPVIFLQETDDTGKTLWLEFRSPARILIARQLNEVLPALTALDDAVQRGWWAAGFISYEAAPAFDPALRTRRPGSLPLLWFGLYRAGNVCKHQSPGVLESWRTGKAGGASDVGHSLLQYSNTPSLQHSISSSAFRRAIAAIRRKIAAGETYQVNYSFRLRAPFRGDFSALAAALLAEGRTSYGAYLDLGDHTLCSLSPELFFRREGERIVCRPMKGTAPRGLTLADDEHIAHELHTSAKNRAENIMIVDMVRNDLGRIARPGSVRTEKLFAVERHNTLWQMTSTVAARTRADWPEVFRALFPCASITGAPKVQTTKIIAALETAPRGIYTGAIGFIAPGRRAQFNVAIRTLHLDRRRGRIEYGTGAGITWDSRAAEEWQECRTKALVLAPTPPFELLETLRWQPGRGYVLLARHLRRMSESAKYFGFVCSRSQVSRALQDAAQKFPPTPQRVRLLLARFGVIRVEATPLPDSKELALTGQRSYRKAAEVGGLPRQADSSALPPPVWKVALAHQPVHSTDPFLFHKTTRRALYEAALNGHPDCDDVILFNERGELTESCYANLVVVRRGRWLTPPVSCGLLAGTQRAELLARGQLTERVLRVSGLKKSDRILLVNSVRGIIETTWNN